MPGSLAAKEPLAADVDLILGPGAAPRRWMGLWWPQGRFAACMSVLRASLTFFCTGAMAITTFLQLLLDLPEEIEEIMFCSFVCLNGTVNFIKAVSLIKEGPNIRQILQLLHKVRNMNGNEEKDNYTRMSYHKIVTRLYIGYQMLGTPGVFGFVTSPLLSQFLIRNTSELPGSGRLLPVPLWLPVDVYQSPAYEITYATLSVWALVNVEATICIDIFFIHLIMMIAAEIEILNVNFAALHKTHVMDMMSEKTYSNFRSQENNGHPVSATAKNLLEIESLHKEPTDELMYQELVTKIRSHQIFIRCVSRLQSAMTIPIFILLLEKTATVCAVVFVSVLQLQRGGNITSALKPLLMIAPEFCQTAMFCIFGSILTEQSEKLTNSAMSCGWTDCDSRFKRSLLIFMTATVQPIEITVGKTCKLSKEMLLQILNGTYGMFNMLYQFNAAE